MRPAVLVIALLALIAAASALQPVRVYAGDCSQDTSKCSPPARFPSTVDSYVDVNPANFRCDPYGKVDGIIADAAKKTGVDALLLCSLIMAESGFHARAGSKAGARGYTQLMPATALGSCKL